MIIYHYDRETKQYLGSSEADICPITGNPVIPAWATDKQPQLISENQRIVFDNGNWILEDIPQPESKVVEPQIITPPVDQNIADIWEALLAVSAEVETLKGGI